MPPKPHLHPMDEVQPERVSSMPTASQVARQRALDKIGKDLVWFDEQVEASLNEHGEPTCAECKQPEKKKLPNGQIKMLTVDTKNARLICDSCSNKQYKQQQRENRSKAHDLDSVESGDAFWTRNRNNKLTEEQKRAYEDRDDSVVLLWNEMKLVLALAKEDPNDFDEPALREFIREVAREVIDNGTIQHELVLIDFWKPNRKAWYDEWVANGGSTAAFLQFGYILALPNTTVHEFFNFAEKHLGLPIALCEEKSVRGKRILDALNGKVFQYPKIVVACATRGCTETKGFSLTEKVPAQWYCPTHQNENDKLARAQLAKINERAAQQQIKDSTGRDAWGRQIIFGDDGEYNS